jgi:Fe-S-cluster containining protein
MKQKELTEKERLCLACRKCCREISIYTHPILYMCDAGKIVDFYKARGFEVTRLEEDAIILSLPHVCPHLTGAGCDIYESRPAACAEYSGIEDFGEACLWSTLEEYRKPSGRDT